MKVYKKNNGVIGFEYEMINGIKRKEHVINGDGDNPNPHKKAKTVTEIKPKSKTKKLSRNQILSDSWRWTKARREICVKKATSVNLFGIKVTGGKRDQQLRVIVHELNQMTDIDVNYLLLREELYKKEIYKIQRRLERLNDEAVQYLPECEQVLFKQLVDAGHIAEARKARLSAEESSVTHCFVGEDPRVHHLISNIYSPISK